MFASAGEGVLGRRAVAYLRVQCIESSVVSLAGLFKRGVRTVEIRRGA